MRFILEGSEANDLIDTRPVTILLCNFLPGLEDQHSNTSLFNLGTRSKKCPRYFKMELVAVSSHPISVPYPHLLKIKQPNGHDCRPHYLLMLEGYLLEGKIY